MSTNHDIDRLKALTDGVIAVSITLLVLDIRLTPPLHGLSDAALGQMLLDIWPKYLGYVTSFVVVGIFWASHERKFRHFVKIDTPLVWLNIFFLMAVGVVPFTTSVVSESPHRIATSVYAATMLLISFLLWLMWRYAGRRGLIDPHLPAPERKRESALGLISMSVFAASIAIAQFHPDAARTVWLLLLIMTLFWRAPASGQKTG